MIKRQLVLMCMCLAIATITYSQTADRKWNIGFHGGAAQYNGAFGNDFYKTRQPFYAFGGISFSRYLGKIIDANLFLTKGEIGHNSPEGNFHSGLSTATVNFRFNLLPPESFVRPYLFIGGGLLMFSVNPTVTEKSKIDYAAPSFGAGANILLGPSVMFQLQETFLYSTNDQRDGVKGTKNVSYLFHSIGFTFNFGQKLDEDKDGVSDRNDKCPGTPPGKAVDKSGCPLDRDKDGVADYLDECPDAAGVVALKGCPDRDGDGVADKDDQCPDEKGLAEFQGCPDKDGDGVADKEDRCPDVKGLVALKGCPDSDGDGIADMDDKCADTKSGYKVDATGCPMDNDKDGIVNEEDGCPDQAGIVSMKGCPDKDGDGVPDIDDRCPEVKGTIANKGCPEMKVEDVKKITQIASKIFFETNSDKLKVASLVQLDELAIILNRYPEANLTIEGHTDDVGKDDYNMTLSQKRTESVKVYLVSKGVSESRLTAIGFGETKPIADNKTDIGRAKNRRVELKTQY